MPRLLVIILLGCLAGVFTPPAHARQVPALSPLCAGGGPEAEVMYWEAARARRWPVGMSHGKGRYRAEELFNAAMEKGNAWAALELADMYRITYGQDFTSQTRYEYMISLYEFAIGAGCPDGYLGLAQNHANGWGMPENKAKAVALLKTGAEKGSPKCMELYGEHLLFETNQTASGARWLHRSIEAGNGEAAVPLAEFSRRTKNAGGIIHALRDGARQGSKECLMRLTLTYQNGLYGQDKDPREADCYRMLYDAIPDLALPRPITDFDGLCPMKPVQPFKL